MRAFTSTSSTPALRSRVRSRIIVTAAATLALASLAPAAGAAVRPTARPARRADVATRPPTKAEASLVAARPYSLHVPPQPKPRAPLLVVLHGYGANGAAQAAYLKIAPVTDAHGMLLVTADGTTNRVHQRFWNATDACCAGPLTHVDDSAYLRAVIADVAAHHRIDPKRVYVMGHSNGGFMSYRMACDHADVVAAIASLEAATWNAPGKCRPSRSVAVLEIHGTGDRTIPYRGGAIRGRRYPSARRTVRLWAGYDGCRLRPDRPAPASRILENGRPPATVLAYAQGCRGNGHVELWTVPGGVHVPSLAPTFAEQVVDYLLAHPRH